MLLAGPRRPCAQKDNQETTVYGYAPYVVGFDVDARRGAGSTPRTPLQAAERAPFPLERVCARPTIGSPPQSRRSPPQSRRSPQKRGQPAKPLILVEGKSQSYLPFLSHIPCGVPGDPGSHICKQLRRLASMGIRFRHRPDERRQGVTRLVLSVPAHRFVHFARLDSCL